MPQTVQKRQVQQIAASGAQYNATSGNNAQRPQNRWVQPQSNSVQNGGNLKYSYEASRHYPFGPFEMKEPKAKSLAKVVSAQMRGVAGRPVGNSNQEQYLVGREHKRKREVYETTGDYQGTNYAGVPTSSAFEKFGQRNNQHWVRDQRFNTVGNGQAFHSNLAYPGRHLQDLSSDKIVFSVDQDLDQMINYRNNMPLARQGVADRGIISTNPVLKKDTRPWNLLMGPSM